MITDDMIECWKVNYGLDKRTPEEAMRWWHDGNGGMAPAGAVAALGLCLLEIERLRTAMRESSTTRLHSRKRGSFEHWNTARIAIHGSQP